MLKKYYIKRLLYLIPHWFFIILIIFLLSKASHRDAVAAKLRQSGIEEDGSLRYQQVYEDQKIKLGFHLPYFYFSIQDAKTESGFRYPKLAFHGRKCQFHQWLKGLLSGDLGNSYISNKPVGKIIWSALTWTIPIALAALLVSILIAFPLARRLSQQSNKYVEGFLMTFYAIPTFWLATLILVFLTNNYYGIQVFDLSVKYGSASGFMNKFQRVLPMIICMIVADLAYLTGVYKTSILKENAKPYYYTALAKGLSKAEAIKKHTSKNALIAISTILVGAIPSALAGSVILETIFNIPGIGRVLYLAVQQGDQPVLYAIVLLIGIFTSLAYLLGDILIARINPKADLAATEL
ncbi:MAG TPA: ABC transporter permease [Saprospiraceae bacterium]|nr:ABC transporter permease [Saprospiraceae bacterium]